MKRKYCSPHKVGGVNRDGTLRCSDCGENLGWIYGADEPARGGCLGWLLRKLLVVACIDQFAMHGTSFEWTSPAHSTWMDGCAFGLGAAGWIASFFRRESIG